VIKGVVFETKGDALKASSKPTLDRIAELLKRYPDVRIEISGHIDNATKADPANDPSLRRPRPSSSTFVDQGIEARRLETRGAGANEPLDSNKTASGRARNRRIEFTILVQ
jgi:outer membrane protein OmpA-like peptidoglycan-associated protein